MELRTFTHGMQRMSAALDWDGTDGQTVIERQTAYWEVLSDIPDVVWDKTWREAIRSLERFPKAKALLEIATSFTPRPIRLPDYGDGPRMKMPANARELVEQGRREGLAQQEAIRAARKQAS